MILKLRQRMRSSDGTRLPGFQVRSVDVAEKTGPLGALNGKRVVGIFDIENLRGGAKDLGLRVSFTTLAQMLTQQSKTCRLHAVFSRDAGDDRQTSYLEKAGYIVHPRDIETVRTRFGEKRLTNSDETILFLAGVHISRGQADVVLIGSGDGNLVCELARNIRALPAKRSIFTLSLAGSTSHRLNAETNPLIDGNLELGLDAVRSIDDAPPGNANHGMTDHRPAS